MDYKENYYQIIENNRFNTLPTKDLIDNDERVAIAVWNNYVDLSFYSEGYDGDNFYDKYKVNWKSILHKYIEDYSFWDKIDLEYDLENNEFKDLFPNVFKNQLSNNDKVLNLLLKTNKIFYFDYLTCSEKEKENIYINYLTKNPSRISKEDVEKYKLSNDLIKIGLNANVFLYKSLSEENKNNEDFIKIVCKNHQYIKELLSVENQKKYIDLWLYNNVDSLNYTVLKSLEDEYINKAFSLMKNLNRIVGAYSNIGKRAKIGFEYHIEKNIEEIIKNHFNIIEDYYKNNNNIKIDKYLENWIDNLTIRNNKSDNKIIKLININKELKVKLENNYNYNISLLLKENHGKLDVKIFEDVYYKLKKEINENKINYDTANQILNYVKSSLPIEVLKERQFPKNNLMQYMSKLDLENIKDTKSNKKIPKNKI